MNEEVVKQHSYSESISFFLVYYSNLKLKSIYLLSICSYFQCCESLREANYHLE